MSIASISGNVSSAKLQELQARVEATKAKLESGDAGRIESLTREDILGDAFYVGSLGYFGQYLALARVMGLRQGAHQYLTAGYGSYGYEPKVSYLFGFPRAIEPGGAVMNVRLTTVTGTSTDDREQHRDFSMQTGLLSSALEHAVPEQMFVTPDSPGEAISAVKALSKATVAGQRIYHITQANQAAALTEIRHDPATMAEIRAALYAGNEVITHASSVSVPGWSGAGYIIFDPDTGDAAYKIGGGQNGGWLIIGVFFFLAAAILVGLFGGPAGWILAAFAFASYVKFAKRVHEIAQSDLSPDEMFERLNQAAFMAVINTVAALMPIFRALGARGTALRAMLASWVFMIDSVMWSAD